MTDEHTEEPKSDEGDSDQTKAKRGQQRARLLTERGAWFLRELLKLRRLDYAQIARLCRLPSANSARSFVQRLEATGHVDSVLASSGQRSTRFTQLTWSGFRVAIASLDRQQTAHFREPLHADTLAHLGFCNDLYLRLVADGALDWLTVRARGSAFVWYPSNEDTEFRWNTPTELNGASALRVAPDVTIEINGQRLLVEAERPTKTQKRVHRKFEQYSDLFSPLKSATAQSGYKQRYSDNMAPNVVFMFTSQARANNARAYFDERAKKSGFYIPRWFCGTVDDVVAELTGVKGGVAEPELDLKDVWRELHRYIFDATATLKQVRETPWGARIALPDNYRRVAELTRALKQKYGR